MFLKLNFNQKLILNFSLFMIILISVFSYFFYRYSSSIILSSALESSLQVTEKISNQIDIHFKQLDITASSTIYNDTIQEIMRISNSDSVQNSLTQFELNKEAAKILRTAFFSLPDISRTIIFNSEKFFYFYYGKDYEEPDVFNKKLKDLSWYNNLIASDQFVTFVPPHLDDWSSKPAPVVSLMRKVVNAYSHELGIIEIQEPYSVLQKICEVSSLSEGNYVIILDNNGSPIFPWKSDALTKDIEFLDFKDMTNGKSIGSGELKTNRNDKLLYSFKNSEYAKWTVILVNKQSQLLNQLSFYRNMIALAGFIILLAVLTVYIFSSRQLTKPLKSLMSTIENVNLNNLNIKVNSYGHDEFDILNQSFSLMFSNIKDTINKLYESKIRETNAHFLALQAQMNPHFLYNTLNVISAQCKTSGNIATAKMCNQLSSMMRYSISSANSFVTLEQEISHTINYLDLMKSHYEEHLDFQINLPEELNSMLLPKISIQPIVENCINHGFENTLPPWKININGQIENNCWKITIEDNGSGFATNVIDSLNVQIKEYFQNLKDGNFKENLSIGGMGVLNTFARLAIYFKDSTIFAIENTLSSGARVTIGGLIIYKEASNNL